MPTRTMVFTSAVVMIGVAAIVASARTTFAQAAADDCLAKPGATAPKGQHWYYRLERASNRRCWYLGAEGAKPRQAAAPRPQPVTRAAPRPEPVAPAASATTAPPSEDTPVRTVTVTAATEAAARDTASAFLQSAPMSTSTPPLDSKQAPESEGLGDEPAATVARDVPPPPAAVTAAEPPTAATAAQPSTAAARPGVAPWHVFAFVGIALALAMLIRKLAREIAARRLLRQRKALREQWQAQAPPPWRTMAGDQAQAGGRQQRHRTAAAAPRPAMPRAPASQRYRAPSVEPDDVEESLRQLLQDWQRVAA